MRMEIADAFEVRKKVLVGMVVGGGVVVGLGVWGIRWVFGF